MGFRVDVSARGVEAYIDGYLVENQTALEGAFLRATDKGARRLKNSIRQAMAGAGLGRLGNAFGSISDLERGGIQKRYENGGFSASGTVYVRSRSERTLGAIQSYTEGSVISPVRGRWLWFPSDDILRVAGSRGNRQRVTPGNWQQLGLESRIGPLTFVRSVNGNPLLVVKNVGVGAAGQSRSARSLNKRGLPRKGQIQREFVVAFIGIPRTARSARIDIQALINQVAAGLPALIQNEIGKI